MCLGVFPWFFDGISTRSQRTDLSLPAFRPEKDLSNKIFSPKRFSNSANFIQAEQFSESNCKNLSYKVRHLLNSRNWISKSIYPLNNFALGHFPRVVPRILLAILTSLWRISNWAYINHNLAKVNFLWGMIFRLALYTSLALSMSFASNSS